MNPVVGWGLAVAAVVVGFVLYGWPGVVLAVTMIVFWLLLQFGRALRVMRSAGSRPVGVVDSAVMLQSRLKPGMTLMTVIGLTHSLGRHVSDEPEQWAWSDSGSACLTLTFTKGRLSDWALIRPAE